MVEVNYIGGGHRSTRRETTDLLPFTDKPYHTIIYRVHLGWVGWELTTRVMIGNACIGSSNSNYHTITTPSSFGDYVSLPYSIDTSYYIHTLDMEETCHPCMCHQALSHHSSFGPHIDDGKYMSEFIQCSSLSLISVSYSILNSHRHSIDISISTVDYCVGINVGNIKLLLFSCQNKSYPIDKIAVSVSDILRFFMINIIFSIT